MVCVCFLYPRGEAGRWSRHTSARAGRRVQVGDAVIALCCILPTTPRRPPEPLPHIRSPQGCLHRPASNRATRPGTAPARRRNLARPRAPSRGPRVVGAQGCALHSRRSLGRPNGARTTAGPPAAPALPAARRPAQALRPSARGRDSLTDRRPAKRILTRCPRRTCGRVRGEARGQVGVHHGSADAGRPHVPEQREQISLGRPPHQIAPVQEPQLPRAISLRRAGDAQPATSRYRKVNSQG
jgi:hypothetical protein